MTLEEFRPFAGRSRAAQWGVLVAMSVVLAVLLEVVRLPAALLLGPMIAAILLEAGGGRVKVPRLPYTFAQAVIGCMVARVITLDILARFLRQWPLFLGVVLAIVAASCVLGIVITKLRILPNTTAVWGLLPGAASAMMLMAEAYGADMRLVAFMQYLRVVFVALAASIVSGLWGHVTGGAPHTVWFPGIDLAAFGGTLALIVFAVIVGPRSRIPAGTLLVPMFLGTVLQNSGLLHLQLPPWLLAVSYLLLGWTVGLRFTVPILLHAARALPQIILSILALIGFSGGLACLLVHFAKVDPLTAYLATSPGGADSVAIIAASSKVDVPFVMALQIVRFLVILMIGPSLSRWLAGMLTKPAGSVS